VVRVNIFRYFQLAELESRDHKCWKYFSSSAWIIFWLHSKIRKDTNWIPKTLNNNRCLPKLPGGEYEGEVTGKYRENLLQTFHWCLTWIRSYWIQVLESLTKLEWENSGFIFSNTWNAQSGTSFPPDWIQEGVSLGVHVSLYHLAQLPLFILSQITFCHQWQRWPPATTGSHGSKKETHQQSSCEWSSPDCCFLLWRGRYIHFIQSTGDKFTLRGVLIAEVGKETYWSENIWKWPSAHSSQFPQLTGTPLRLLKS
jgi:hypothetical protein